MRKLITISLLLLLLLCMGGHRCAGWLAARQADAALLANIEAGVYQTQALITLKVAVSLPYQTSWDRPERVDGEISYGGRHYRYVSRQLINDTMVLKCLPHTGKDAIEWAVNNAGNRIGEASGTEKGKWKAPIFASDYDDYIFQAICPVPLTPEPSPYFSSIEAAPAQDYYLRLLRPPLS